MTGAKTAKGSDSNIVTIVEKTTNITSINKITVDTSGLVHDDDAKKQEIASHIQALLTKDAVEAGIFNPRDKKGYEVSVTIRNMKQQINVRAVYAIVNVLNPTKEAVYSFASVETSEGLRTLDHIEDTFAKSAIQAIKKPLEQPTE